VTAGMASTKEKRRGMATSGSACSAASPFGSRWAAAAGRGARPGVRLAADPPFVQVHGITQTSKTSALTHRRDAKGLPLPGPCFRARRHRTSAGRPPPLHRSTICSSPWNHAKREDERAHAPARGRGCGPGARWFPGCRRLAAPQRCASGFGGRARSCRHIAAAARSAQGPGRARRTGEGEDRIQASGRRANLRCFAPMCAASVGLCAVGRYSLPDSARADCTPRLPGAISAASPGPALHRSASIETLRSSVIGSSGPPPAGATGARRPGSTICSSPDDQ